MSIEAKDKKTSKEKVMEMLTSLRERRKKQAEKLDKMTATLKSTDDKIMHYENLLKVKQFKETDDVLQAKGTTIDDLLRAIEQNDVEAIEALKAKMQKEKAHDSSSYTSGYASTSASDPYTMTNSASSGVSPAYSTSSPTLNGAQPTGQKSYNSY